MKLIHHNKTTCNPRKITDVDFSGKRMIVWLSRWEQLTIERGDRLDRVAAQLTNRVPKVKRRRIVALWFALGERAARGEHSKPWRAREFRTAGSRRYLVS